MGRLAAERKHGNSRHAGMSERELRKILVVEDDPDIRRVAETALTGSRGFSVRTCSSGREALVAAPEFQPELVLLDLTMPAMDGPETLAELRKDHGAFFKSIYDSLNHIMYDDLAFLSRFTGNAGEVPDLGVDLLGTFERLRSERPAQDRRTTGVR